MQPPPPHHIKSTILILSHLLHDHVNVGIRLAIFIGLVNAIRVIVLCFLIDFGVICCSILSLLNLFLEPTDLFDNRRTNSTLLYSQRLMNTQIVSQSPLGLIWRTLLLFVVLGSGNRQSKGLEAKCETRFIWIAFPRY
jgi:hypothetical protein